MDVNPRQYLSYMQLVNQIKYVDSLSMPSSYGPTDTTFCRRLSSLSIAEYLFNFGDRMRSQILSYLAGQPLLDFLVRCCQSDANWSRDDALMLRSGNG